MPLLRTTRLFIFGKSSHLNDYVSQYSIRIEITPEVPTKYMALLGTARSLFFGKKNPIYTITRASRFLGTSKFSFT